MASFKKTKKIDLSTKYPGAPPEAIDFLNKILVFNPYFRMSLSDALQHPLFANIKKTEVKEEGSPLSLDIENVALEIDALRRGFVQEIK